jgi:hypothetical protein
MCGRWSDRTLGGIAREGVAVDPVLVEHALGCARPPRRQCVPARRRPRSPPRAERPRCRRRAARARWRGPCRRRRRLPCPRRDRTREARSDRPADRHTLHARRSARRASANAPRECTLARSGCDPRLPADGNAEGGAPGRGQALGRLRRVRRCLRDPGQASGRIGASGTSEVGKGRAGAASSCAGSQRAVVRDSASSRAVGPDAPSDRARGIQAGP